MGLLSWFGKKEAVNAVSGIGKWIDEQQLTSEEQVKYKMQLFEVMAPFKQIQRIMVTIIMYHWIVWCGNCLLAIWLGYLMSDTEYLLLGKLVEYAKLEMVWVPTASAVGLYLGGGLPIFNRNK